MSDDLIKRLENAQGPNRELDREIAIATRDTFDPQQFVPAWTRLIDAALRLLPETENVVALKIERNPSEFGRLWHVAFRHQFFGHAQTPAIALCIAALRARAAIAAKTDPSS